MPQPERDEHPNGDPKVQIARLQEQLRAHQRETDIELQHRDESLKLQAEKYENRLQDLNHAHQQAREKESSFVSVDKFETFRDDITEWKNQVVGRSGGSLSLKENTLSIIALLIAIVSILVRYKG